MAIVVKNIDSTANIYAGMEIQPSASYTIQQSELSKWQSSDLLLQHIAEGKAQINDGTQDISGIANQTAYLMGSDLSPKDSDGVPLQRVKIAQTGWSFQLHGFEIETSKLNSIYSKDEGNSDTNFTTVKFYDSNNTELTTQQDIDSGCVKTVVDWEPTFNYELIGGMLFQIGLPSENLYMWTIGVPDIPSNMGGSKVFINCMNLKFIGTEQALRTDGRVPKTLNYNATYHTNKMRFIFRHPAGFKHKLLISFELFKP